MTAHVDLDTAPEVAVGWRSAVVRTADSGLVPPVGVRNVVHGLADVPRQGRLGLLDTQLDLLGEPTVDDLREIEAEADVIAAELAVVDAEIRFIGRPSTDSRRHLRRTQHALARALAVHANHPSTQGDLS